MGVVAYLLAFGLGLSSGPWVVNSEIYPARVRGLGQSAACTMNWAANYVVAATFLTLRKVLGEPGTFLVFSAVGFGGAAWLAAALPETAGRGLEDIEDLFKRQAYERVPSGPVPNPVREADPDDEPIKPTTGAAADGV